MVYVVFDMDGLMFDTERVYAMSWDYAGEKMGIGKAGYMVPKTLGLNVEAVNVCWKREFGSDFDMEKLRRIGSAFRADYYAANGVPVRKGLYRLLDRLRAQGAKLAIATSSPMKNIDRNLGSAGLTGRFDALVCGDMVTRSKPEPDIFLRACKLLGAPPRETYVLEDSKNGILAAHRAGCRPVMVPDLQPADDEVRALAAGIFADLDEVCEAFENGILG